MGNQNSTPNPAAPPPGLSNSRLSVFKDGLQYSFQQSVSGNLQQVFRLQAISHDQNVDEMEKQIITACTSFSAKRAFDIDGFATTFSKICVDRREELAALLKLFGSPLSLIKSIVSLAVVTSESTFDIDVFHTLLKSLVAWLMDSPTPIENLDQINVDVSKLEKFQRKACQIFLQMQCFLMLGFTAKIQEWNHSANNNFMICFNLNSNQLPTIAANLPNYARWMLHLPMATKKRHATDKVFFSAKEECDLNGIVNADLIFSTKSNGKSLKQFSHCLIGYDGPTFLFVQTSEGEIFGAFVSKKWEEGTPMSPFFGDNQCFLFTIKPSLRIYSSLDVSTNYCHFPYRHPSDQSNEDDSLLGIGVGGQRKHYRIFLSNDLMHGQSGAFCSTFQEGKLSTKEEFNIEQIEVWGIGGESALKNREQFWSTTDAVAERSRKVKLTAMFGGQGNILDNPDKTILDIAGITGFSNSVRDEDERMEAEKRDKAMYQKIKDQNQSN